jgi:uncharacterized protein YjbI with pentapeptide repeats
MARKQHLQVLRQGRDQWDAWRKEHPKITPDLSEADLRGMELKFVDFRRADLTRSNLSGIYAAHGQFHNADLRGADLRDGHFPEASFLHANLSNVNAFAADFAECDFAGARAHRSVFQEARLVRADLQRASLREADLTEADFSSASLERAKLCKAVLVGSNLNAANLIDTDFTNAEFGDTVLVNTNLKASIGLDTINHFRRSFVDIDTLIASGELPTRFLQGLGLSDAIIDYLPSLLNRPIQFYSCFISYSVKDEPVARRLHSDLQARGVRCWFAPQDMRIGDRIRDRIDESIRVHDKLLVVLSRHSIGSAWVEKEVETAFEQETTRGAVVLFPIRLDDAVMETQKAWAADITRTRHIGDFRQWKDHDQYEIAFNRLLRDLRPSGVIAT